MSEPADVRAEAVALMAMRSRMTPREIASLRRYAWRRSAFPDPDARLSRAAAAWRELFRAFDKQLSDILDPQQKDSIDRGETRIASLDLAERMLAYRMKKHPKESRVGTVLSLASFALGFLVGWLLLQSVLMAVLLAIPIGLACTLCSAVVFQDTWSTTLSTKWMYASGRLLPPLRNAALRLTNTNVLGTQEYNKIGDPERISFGITQAESLFQRQEASIAAAFQTLNAPEHRGHIRSVEDRLVQSEMPESERLSEANALISFVDRARSTVTDGLDTLNDELDIELLEVQRQVEGLPVTQLRQCCEEWLAVARHAYLHSRCAASVIFNRLDFDACISAGITRAAGKLDFSLSADEVATQATSSYWTPELENERERLFAAREQARARVSALFSMTRSN